METLSLFYTFMDTNVLYIASHRIAANETERVFRSRAAKSMELAHART